MDGFGEYTSMETSEIREFGIFLSRVGLFDVPLLGSRYTWVRTNKGRGFMSRLDRAMVSDGWWDSWGLQVCWIWIEMFLIIVLWC